MGARKSACLIERDGQRAVPCPHLQNSVLCAIFPQEKRDKRLPIPLALGHRLDSKVFQFQHAVPLVRYDADSTHAARIAERVHIPAFQIAVDHILLLVPKQKQIKILLPVFHDSYDLHMRLCYPSQNSSSSVLPSARQIAAQRRIDGL